MYANSPKCPPEEVYVALAPETITSNLSTDGIVLDIVQPEAPVESGAGETIGAAT